MEMSRPSSEFYRYPAKRLIDSAQKYRFAHGFVFWGGHPEDLPLP